ncbi:cobalt-transporting P-type ATPase (cobalt efflux pump) involved in cobalt tolerance [Rivularia sp. IAM M-261]|nr:cobalt-transporting P-type ATPase (cobalt efflux pump) involved in cobalt tolerance [Calothrix sp. PCC 7716]GJD17421.1 cobalt-transporting P-type ATPase (cobalt efflux pump) involved in cobalt tolerance [Rivularia sp. IAM M-261]
MAGYSFTKLDIRRLTTEHPDAVAAGCCALFLLFGWLGLYFGWVGLALLLMSVAYVVGGYASAKEGLTTLVEEKEFDVDLLMIVAALGAAALGLWKREYHLIVDGAVLILIFAISGALEGYAMARTNRAITSLMRLTPDTARVISRGQEKQVAINQLQIGDKLLVKPGELIPTDSVITEGASNLNEASITGESLPVEKTIGDYVYAGTINGTGALVVEVHQPPESSLIQRVIRLVEQAQNEAPASQLFIERFERAYAKVIILCGIVLMTVPSIFLNQDWETTIYRALIFLVVASPCALMAAIMPTLLSGIATGARNGILFKSGADLEMVGKVRAVAFDKTGTLTTGQPRVEEIIPSDISNVNSLLILAAAVESFSEHPIGQAIVAYGNDNQLNIPSATNVVAHTGFGISGEVNSKQVLVGKVSFIQAQTDILINQDLIEHSTRLETEGKTTVWVAENNKILGIIGVADTVRTEAAMMVKRLKKLGAEIIMLTGDNQRTASYVAQQLGILEVYASLLPEDKVTVIKRLQREYKTVAMVGDGINDAPALATASVGIAMGVAGSDVALETADIVLMADKLEKLVVAIELGKRSIRVVKQNIAFALTSVLILLVINFTVGITLPLGVVGHEGSTVLVTLSGLRLLKNRY